MALFEKRITLAGSPPLPGEVEPSLSEEPSVSAIEKADQPTVAQLMAALKTRYRMDDVTLGTGTRTEGAVPVWAERVNINATALAAATDWTFSLDGNTYNFVGPGLPSLPCRNRISFKFTCATDLQIVATFVSDTSDIAENG